MLHSARDKEAVTRQNSQKDSSILNEPYIIMTDLTFEKDFPSNDAAVGTR